MIKINVIIKNAKWLYYIKNPNDYLDRKLNKISKKNKIFKKKNIFCTLLLSDGKEIKFLNKKFRKKNKITDILSFPYQFKKDLEKKRTQKLEVYLGDMIININKINSDSKKVFKNHFNILWVHGLLHLFGYDHQKEKNYKKMNYFEKKFLKKIR